MTGSVTMTIRVSEDTLAKLERIADATQRSKSFLAGEAVSAYVKRELPIIEGILQGMADAEAGRVIPHEVAMAELYDAIAKVEKQREENTVRPKAVTFSPETGMTTVEFSNGSTFAFPTRALKGLENATATQLVEVELLGDDSLHWETLDVDYPISTIMAGLVGFKT